MFGKNFLFLFQNKIFMKIWQNYGLQTLFGQIDNGLHLLLRLFFYILPAGKDIRIGLLYEIKWARMVQILLCLGLTSSWVFSTSNPSMFNGFSQCRPSVRIHSDFFCRTQFLPHTIKTEHEEIRIGNTFSLSDSNAYVNSDYEMSTASETDPFAEITIDDDDQMCQEIITAFASDPLNISPNFTQ